MYLCGKAQDNYIQMHYHDVYMYYLHNNMLQYLYVHGLENVTYLGDHYH